MKIEIELWEEEAGREEVAEEVEERCTAVEREIGRKVSEMRHGGDASTDMYVQCLAYTLDTCPGSSGAGVVAYRAGEDGLRKFDGHHSKGREKNKGNLCGAGGSRVVPVRK